jgi:hypothetical protein
MVANRGAGHRSSPATARRWHHQSRRAPCDHLSAGCLSRPAGWAYRGPSDDVQLTVRTGRNTTVTPSYPDRRGTLDGSTPDRQLGAHDGRSIHAFSRAQISQIRGQGAGEPAPQGGLAVLAVSDHVVAARHHHQTERWMRPSYPGMPAAIAAVQRLTSSWVRSPAGSWSGLTSVTVRQANPGCPAADVTASKASDRDSPPW